MSLRTVLRYAMPTIIVVLAIGPAIAQPPNPWRIYTAPMPRLKSAGMHHFEFGFEIGSGPVLHGRGIGFELAPTGVPWSRKVPSVIIQAEEEHIKGERSGQLRITPRPVTPPTCGPVPMAMTQGVGNTRQSANNPFSVQFSCAPPGAQFLPAREEMTYTWGYHGSIPQRLVAVPRITNRLDCGLPTPCPVEAGGPEIIVAASLPNELSEWPYSLPLARAMCRDGAGGWWLDATPVPQPRHAMPVVIIQQVRERGPAIVADVRNFGFRVVNECAGPVRGNALSAVGATSRLCCQSEPAECCEKDAKLSGTWYRDLDGVVVAATFAGDELKLCMTQNAEGMIAHMTLTANYAITKEGMVHGVITGADADVKSMSAEGSARATTAMTEGIAEMQKLVDCPFSFRVKSTSVGVMVSNLRVAVDGMNSKEMAILCGMFRHAVDGIIPTPRAMNTHTTGSTRCNGSDCPGPARVPVNAGAPPCSSPMLAPTHEVPAGYAVPSTPGPVVPMLVPPTLPGETSSAVPNPRLAEVLGTKEAMKGGTMLQSGRYLEHYPQYFPPDPQHPLPRELAAQADSVGAEKLAIQSAGIAINPSPTSGGAGPVLVVMPSPTYSPPRPTHIPPGDFGMMADVFGQMLGAKTQPGAQPATVHAPVVTTAPVPPMAIPTPPGSERPR